MKIRTKKIVSKLLLLRKGYIFLSVVIGVQNICWQFRIKSLLLVVYLWIFRLYKDTCTKQEADNYPTGPKIIKQEMFTSIIMYFILKFRKQETA